jgi:hypothetical protein
LLAIYNYEDSGVTDALHKYDKFTLAKPFKQNNVSAWIADLQHAWNTWRNAIKDPEHMAAVETTQQFYAEMGMMFSERSRRICKFFTPKSTQVCAVPGRGNQGQTQHKGTAAGTAYAALVARRRSRRGLVSSSDPDVHRVLRFFYYYSKLTGNRVSLFSFHRFHQN